MRALTKFKKIVEQFLSLKIYHALIFINAIIVCDYLWKTGFPASSVEIYKP